MLSNKYTVFAFILSHLHSQCKHFSVLSKSGLRIIHKSELILTGQFKERQVAMEK